MRLKVCRKAKEDRSMMNLRGSQNLSMRLLLSMLTLKPISIRDIRSDAMPPGLLQHEVSLLRLLHKISDGCFVQINGLSGTKLIYQPGTMNGGKGLKHDCSTSRSIGYFLEPVIVLGLFGKNPLSITLKGITNDSKDPSVDTFQTTTLQLLRKFGVPPENVNLKINSRGVPPYGGGEVFLSILPIEQDALKVDAGRVESISGSTFSTGVYIQHEHKMLQAVRKIFGQVLQNIRIDTDHRVVKGAAKPRGYGISLVAKTREGCYISADTAVSCDDAEDIDELKDETNGEEVGARAAESLVAEILQRGVVDSTHQGLLFLLCALCPLGDVSKVRVGKLSPDGIEVLGLIKAFLGVVFDIKSDPDPSTERVILMCVGSGLKNLSKKGVWLIGL